MQHTLQESIALESIWPHVLPDIKWSLWLKLHNYWKWSAENVRCFYKSIQLFNDEKKDIKSSELKSLKTISLLQSWSSHQLFFSGEGLCNYSVVFVYQNIESKLFYTHWFNFYTWWTQIQQYGENYRSTIDVISPTKLEPFKLFVEKVTIEKQIITKINFESELQYFLKNM